jgi:hypothetical protein
MKPIIKATLLSGFTAPLWAGAILVVILLFNWDILRLPIENFFEYYVDFGDAEGPSAFVAMVLIFDVFLLFSYVPFLVFGMFIGFILSIYFKFIPEHRRKDYKIISSLKYRARSFRDYCLFIGESFLGIVALLSLPLCILSLIIPPEVEWIPGPPIQVTLIKLALAVLVTALSARIIWRCEVHITEEIQSAAQSLPAEKQRHPIAVKLTVAFGNLLVSVLTIQIIVSFFAFFIIYYLAAS